METDSDSKTNETEAQGLDLHLCIICQRKKSENLVEKPEAHEKVLVSIEEWSKYGNPQYTEAWNKLRFTSVRELEDGRASWHRSCYKDAVHAGMLKRARERYERQLEGPNESRRKSSVEIPQLTRSKTSPYNKNVCFFCDGPPGYRKNLHTISTFSAGESLRTAIGMSGDDKLAVKLNTAIAPDDAHSIDIKYHKKCWAIHVSHVLRRETSQSSSEKVAGEIAAQIEFLTMTEMTLSSGKVATMSELQDAFESILESNNVENSRVGRKALKQLLLREIPEIEFHAPKRVNESERVSIKKTRDQAIQMAEDQTAIIDSDMKTLFDAAAIIRKSITKCRKWKFTGSLKNLPDENVPAELFSFHRWIIQGPKHEPSAGKKCEEVYNRAMALSQTTVSLCLTERQVKNKKSDVVRSSSEMPLQLAVGIAVHQAVRSKQLINMLHGFGMSVDYNRILRVDAQIEASVLKRMELNNGLYIPPDVVLGRHVFFAVDNVDFAEDTPDGKNTFHGTAMAIYQRQEAGDVAPELTVDPGDQCLRSIRQLPESVTTLLECPAPPGKPVGPTFPQFGLCTKDQLPSYIKKQDFAWLLGRSLTRKITNGEAEDNQIPSSNIPVWSGYNSTMSSSMPLTRVGTPPLIAAPAHEWQTLLTILKQAQNINTTVVGENRRTVISLDMGLYQPAKKLQMTRQDLGHIILRPGELHIVMAQLRTIGAFIENSGLDMCWVESDLYGPSTVKQILGGNHVKRGEAAHMVTLQALFSLYQEAFFVRHPAVRTLLEKLANQLSDACKKGDKQDITAKHEELVQTINSTELAGKMEQFDADREGSPLFKFTREYMAMVLEMMTFIRAVRTGDWDLHLEALKLFVKYFFAHDMLNYARMIPVYLAEMEIMKDTDPEIYQEFQNGNWVVNKNAKVAFCAVGADNALEHVNRSMKVSGGLIGITLNPTARTKYFLIAPELARLAEEAKLMAGTSSKAQTSHHNLTTAVRLREERNVQQLTASIQRFTDPFTVEDPDLFNLVTKVRMPEKVKKDLCDQSVIGNKLFGTFLKERIQTAEKSIWDVVNKRKLLTWKTTGKTVRVATKDKIIELKEDRCLFARMMVICKSRPEIDIKEAVGVYEFSVVPRSMFAADGNMLHCSAKSALMSILEKLPSDRSVEQAEPTDQFANADVQIKVSIVDGMAEVQALEKPDWIKTCSDLANQFTVTIFDKYKEADEIRLIFDRFVTPADIYLVKFVFILDIITYISGHVILLLGMMYHCL